MSAVAAAELAPQTNLARVGDVLRDIARGGMAATIAGLVVGGMGGRLLMTVFALMNPDANGLRTENGERVGEFTVNGTMALVFFGGMLLAGFLAAVVWVVISPWMPFTGPRRWLLAMPVAVVLGGYFLVESTNRDFVILGPTVPIVAMLLALVALMGATVAWLDERLDRVLPRAGSRALGVTLAYATFAVLGLPALIMALLAYFSESFSRGPMPVGVGYALLVAGVATVLWWLTRIRTGRHEPAPGILAAGRIGLVAAVVMGAAHLWTEVSRLAALS
jgi:hypothetical protein